MFGVDSALYFLPASNNLSTTKNILHPLEDLLIKRNKSQVISKDINSTKLIENFFELVIRANGIATVVLTDSNMGMYIVAVGNQFIVNNLWQNLDKTNLDKTKVKKIHETDFLIKVDIGINLSVLS